MTHDEIINGLHMASGIVQNRQALLHGKTHGRDMSPTELCLDSSYTSAIDACAAAATEIQRLGAQLAEIARSRPVAWVRHRGDGGIDGPLLDHQVEPVRRMSWTPLIAAEWADRSAPQPPAAEPVLEIRACGCGAAKNGRCVMGDYGALPIGTQLYAGAAPERAEPQPRPTCSSSGLLGSTSGVGRECGMWIEGVCTSPEPCQHQQRPCRCGPDGCSDSVACPKGGAA